MEDLNIAKIKRTTFTVTQDVISTCRFCVEMSIDPENKTPVHCIKYSGCAIPVQVNASTCLSCQEYKRSGNHRVQPNYAAAR